MDSLIALTLGGSVMALLLLGLKKLLGARLPSTVYYYAWILVLLRFSLPLPGLVPAPQKPASAEAAVTSPAIVRDRPYTGYSVSGGGYVVIATPAATGDAPDLAPADEPAAPQPTTAPKPTRLVFDWRAPKLWWTVWAAGTGLTMAATTAVYLRFTRRLRRSLKPADPSDLRIYAAIPGRKPDLYRSSAHKTPLMYGVFHPRIVLPDRVYDDETLYNILRHELTHFRRFDTMYKWASVAVLSTQWFNPLSYYIRQEISRACELSCDEMLLRTMDRDGKQSYGNTLLSMAASAALPAGVVATTFATEKRNLKERLEQIMNYKKSGTRVLAALLALVLLAGCGAVAGPKTEPDTPAEEGIVRVSTVDEFLAAIAPDTVIELAAGEYDLSTATTYCANSASPYYTWGTVYAGESNKTAAELEIRNVQNLTIRGAGMDATVIAAIPRYANVIRFHGCQGLRLENLTAGHTREPGFCMGGVLRLENCLDTVIDSCGLFGCGTIGVWAQDCVDLTVTGSHIYECSYEAVEVSGCRDVRVTDCDVYSHGVREGQGSAASLFLAANSDGFTVDHCRIYNNSAEYLTNLRYTRGARFISNEVHDNAIVGTMFLFEQYGAVVDGCGFADNSFRHWLPNTLIHPTSLDGTALDSAALDAMTYRDLDPAAEAGSAPMPATGVEVNPGERIVVTTVDEFLAAIGPERTIVLDGELFDLSAASDYGAFGGEYYFWNQAYDGPELVINNAPGLTITAAADSPEATTLAAIPRYANVLNFVNCERLQLVGFTLGHTKEPGSCSGGVVHLDGCSDVRVDSCRLYGCGILGLQVSRCTSLEVLRTEIYECSQGAGSFFQSDGIRFMDCDIHDVPSPALFFNECGDKTWNDTPIDGLNSRYDVDADGNLVEIRPEYEDPADYTGSVNDLVNPFGVEPTHPLEPGTPIFNFATWVQKAFADRDWLALAEQMSFPVQIFVEDYSYVIHDREEFMDMIPQGDFTGVLFTDEFCDLITQADVSEYGSCVFGNTVLDHRIAITCFGDQLTEDTLRIRAISFADPLYPGRAPEDYVQAVPPTPQP